MSFLSGIGNAISSVTQPIVNTISNVVAQVPVVGKPLASLETGTLDYLTGHPKGAIQAFNSFGSNPLVQNAASTVITAETGVPVNLGGIGGVAGTPTAHLPTVNVPGASSYGQPNGGLASPTSLPTVAGDYTYYYLAGIVLGGAYLYFRRKHK